MINSTFDRVVVVFVSTEAETGDDEIAYSNNPSDVGDVSGRMLSAFQMSL